jgi:hypothetical protein
LISIETNVALKHKIATGLFSLLPGQSEKGSPMRKQVTIAISICLISLLPAMTSVAQEPSSFIAKGSGEGTIKLGKEEFKLHAVLVKLYEDGKADFHLVSDITVFIQGSWTRSNSASKDIDLKISGNVTSDSLDGVGKLSLSEDNKTIIHLRLEVLNKISKKVIKVEFAGK